MRLSAGNEHEQRHLLALVDELLERGIKPGELWADRGYDAEPLRLALNERGIQPKISKRRKRGEPIPDGVPARELWRGRKRYQKAPDPNARHRWPIERTNAWLKARRRVATRRDRKPENYLAFIQLAMILVLARSF